MSKYREGDELVAKDVYGNVLRTYVITFIEDVYSDEPNGMFTRFTRNKSKKIPIEKKIYVSYYGTPNGYYTEESLKKEKNIFHESKHIKQNFFEYFVFS